MGDMYLCGGTFLTLLTQYKKKNPKTKKTYGNYVLLGGLAKIMGNDVTETYKGSSASVSTSGYRACEDKAPSFLLIEDDVTGNRFHTDVLNAYDKKLTEAEDFVEKYISISKEDPWLVRALLELLNNDIASKPSDCLYALPDGNAISIERLVEANYIYLPSLILGIWDYIIYTKRDNTKGKETFLNMTTQNGDQNEYVLNASEIGNTIEQDICLCDSKEKAIQMLNFTDEEDEIVDDSWSNPDVISGKIAPDISQITNGASNFLMAFAEAIGRFKGKYATYLSKVYADYQTCTTYLYKTKRPFKDFYVCNNVSPKIISPISFGGEIPTPSRSGPAIENICLEKFKHHNMLIIGSGGLGKSMMMNHFLLDAVETYDNNKVVPIMIPVRQFKSNEQDALLNLLFREFTKYDPNLVLGDMMELLNNGQALILLDGYDEIQSEYRENFKNEIDRLVVQYPKSWYVISSRNNKQLRLLDRFVGYDILPLLPKQAYEMISRLDPREVSDDLKERFINDLKTNKFNFNRDETREFLGNPLLITIMLTTYAVTNTISTKRYLFYDDAYSVLAQRHDGDKGITREFATGLDIREFKIRFGEFCALAFSNQEYEFPINVFEEYLQEVIDINHLNTTVEAFIKDITEKLCLIYLDDKIYRWVHRSFQEYFAAFFFSLQLPKDFPSIYRIFTCYDESLDEDETLPMLFGLDQRKTELCIIIPYLEERFINCEREEPLYDSFLRMYYPEIFFGTGQIEAEYDNTTEWALYNFIVNQYGLHREITGEDFDNDEEYATSRTNYYTIFTDWQDPEERGRETDMVREEDIPIGYDSYYDPEYEGSACRIEVSDVIFSERMLRMSGHSRDYIYDRLADENFPLWQEFMGIEPLYRRLKKKYEDNKDDNPRKSFLSNFH